MILPETWWLLSIGTAVLVIAAVGGYWLGRHRLRPARPKRRRARPEVERALSIVGDLESVASQLQHALSHHGSALRRFASRLVRYEREQDIARHELCDQAEEMLKPAMRLTAEISHAYAQLAQQMSHLATFAELRTDPITGAANRIVLDETVAALLSDGAQDASGVTVAMIGIDFFEQIDDSRSNLQGDRVLVDLVAALRQTIRPCDLLARFGNEDFVIVMPETDATSAAELAERIRTAVRDQLPVTVSIGLAAARNDESPGALLGRASAALAKAKAAGHDCVYQLDDADTQAGPTPSKLPAPQTSAPSETAPQPDVEPIAGKRAPQLLRGSSAPLFENAPPSSEDTPLSVSPR